MARGCSSGPREAAAAAWRLRRGPSPAGSAMLAAALHERPIISRLTSLDHPVELREGMVFALEPFCPATDGYSSARIEEEVVVTADGTALLTLFPAEDLFVTNPY